MVIMKIRRIDFKFYDMLYCLPLRLMPEIIFHSNSKSIDEERNIVTNNKYQC